MAAARRRRCGAQPRLRRLRSSIAAGLHADGAEGARRCALSRVGCAAATFEVVRELAAAHPRPGRCCPPARSPLSTAPPRSQAAVRTPSGCASDVALPRLRPAIDDPAPGRPASCSRLAGLRRALLAASPLGSARTCERRSAASYAFARCTNRMCRVSSRLRASSRRPVCGLHSQPCCRSAFPTGTRSPRSAPTADAARGRRARRDAAVPARRPRDGAPRDGEDHLPRPRRPQRPDPAARGEGATSISATSSASPATRRSRAAASRRCRWPSSSCSGRSGRRCPTPSTGSRTSRPATASATSTC